jgi:Tol biopolymer transport system component
VRAFRFGDPPDAIHVVNADGSGDRTLADGEAPSWSPDGRRLAFADGGRIWTIEVAGGRRAQVAEPGRPVNGLLLADPGWSPRGDEIAYRAERNGVSELLAVRPNGSGGRRITAADVEDFTWSPDGRRLAVSLPRRLGIVAARGGRLRLLRRDGLAKSRPHWSQDGRRLAYAASGGGSSEVWLADTRTLDEHQLTAHCQIARPR